MRRIFTLMVVGLLAGCGDPGRATVEDAQDAKQRAQEATEAAEAAAKRVEALSQPQATPEDGA